jgi:hypothetical protein
VFAAIPNHLTESLRSPRGIAAISLGVATLIGAALYFFRRPRPTPEEIERARRDLLATKGRITDGTITDAPVAPEQAANTPNIIVYNYRIAGVTYECAQDVSALPDQVHDIRTDLPIQVRYAPHNPGNSIVVAESWSGLRLKSSYPYESGDRG